MTDRTFLTEILPSSYVLICEWRALARVYAFTHVARVAAQNTMLCHENVKIASGFGNETSTLLEVVSNANPAPDIWELGRVILHLTSLGLCSKSGEFGQNGRPVIPRQGPILRPLFSLWYLR